MAFYPGQVPYGLSERQYRDIIWQLMEAIDPDSDCICEDGTKQQIGEAVPTCAYHGGRTWWMVRRAREVKRELVRLRQDSV